MVPGVQLIASFHGLLHGAWNGNKCISLRFGAPDLDSDQRYWNGNDFGFSVHQRQLPVGTLTIGTIVRAARLS